MFDIVTRLTRTRPVPHLIAGPLLVLTLMSLVPASLNGAQGGKTEVFPVQKAAPAAVFIETAGSEVELRRQLRVKNGVSELSSATSVIRFSVAPTGSFGFITPKLLGMALITQSPDLSLEQIPPVSNAFEIHKLADGSGMLVGFVEARPQASADAESSGRRMSGSGSIPIPRSRLRTSSRCPWSNWLSIGCRSDSIPRNPAVRSCSIWICRAPPTVRRLKPGLNPDYS